MRRGLVVLLVILGVLVGLVAVADRVAVAVAEREVGKQLAGREPFVDAPKVDIAGFPFLTQALSGNYRHIVVSGDGLRIGDYSGAQFHADLHGVHVPLSDVTSGKVNSLPVDTATGWIVLPYSELARLAKVDGVTKLTIVQAGDGVRVSATVNLPVIGSVAATGTGTAKLADGKLLISVSKATVDGVSLPAATLSAVAQALGLNIDIPELPYGLQLSSVTAVANGVQISGHAADLTLQ
jgi:hypothetical protein